MTQIWSPGREDPLQQEMATHSKILAWKIPWTEEPGGLQFMGLQRVGHDWAKHVCACTHTHTHRLNIKNSLTLLFIAHSVSSPAANPLVYFQSVSEPTAFPPLPSLPPWSSHHPIFPGLSQQPPPGPCSIPAWHHPVHVPQGSQRSPVKTVTPSMSVFFSDPSRGVSFHSE